MRLIVAKDYADVSRKAANIIAAQIQLKPDCVLGLATGSSPVGTYKELIAKYESGELDFSQVRTINLDDPDQEFGWADLVREYREGVRFNHALSNSFAFGGSNASIIISRCD